MTERSPIASVPKGDPTVAAARKRFEGGSASLPKKTSKAANKAKAKKGRPGTVLDDTSETTSRLGG